MSKQFSTEMGAIRICSHGRNTRHRGQNKEQWCIPPKNWTPIKARRYVKPGGMFSRKQPSSLADVIGSGVLDNESPVVIVVHMGCSFGSASAKVTEQQVAVIRAAKAKEIPIYVVDKKDLPKPSETLGPIPDTLINQLKHATQRYEHLHYYAERSLGNALEGKRYQDGSLLRDDLRGQIGARVAIVFGQSYGGQCVDSTILGMYTSSAYSEGLLDIEIDVVTARDVLEPPQPGTTGSDSPYFSFNIGQDILLTKPLVKPASTSKASAGSTALTVPTSASTDYPKEAATTAATQV